MMENGEHQTSPNSEGTPLPPELAEFLLGQQYAALLHATNQGTALVVKAPRHEIDSVRGRVPIEMKHEFYSHPAAPVIRMVTRFHDQPNSSLALETYINVEDNNQRADYAALAEHDHLLMFFYDELLRHGLTKRVGGVGPEAIEEVLKNADRLLAVIPISKRDFDRAKSDVMKMTAL